MSMIPVRDDSKLLPVLERRLFLILWSVGVSLGILIFYFVLLSGFVRSFTNLIASKLHRYYHVTLMLLLLPCYILIYICYYYYYRKLSSFWKLYFLFYIEVFVWNLLTDLINILSLKSVICICSKAVRRKGLSVVRQRFP